MESSTSRLEASCKQLEDFCDCLKKEKYELEQRLRVEKETVGLLQKRIKDLEFDKVFITANVIIIIDKTRILSNTSGHIPNILIFLKTNKHITDQYVL